MGINPKVFSSFSLAKSEEAPSLAPTPFSGLKLGWCRREREGGEGGQSRAEQAIKERERAKGKTK